MKKKLKPTPLTVEQKVERIIKAIHRLGDNEMMLGKIKHKCEMRLMELPMMRSYRANIIKQAETLSAWGSMSGQYTQKETKAAIGRVMKAQAVNTIRRPKCE